MLDEDVYADVRSIRQAMERRRAPFYLRRTKEAMVYFPERRPDATWVAEKIFTKRIPRTVDFQKWHEVTQVKHYYLSVNALKQPMEVKERAEKSYRGGEG